MASVQTERKTTKTNPLKNEKPPARDVVKRNPIEGITVKGAREHNLKNIDIFIPRDRITVITGLSGSGKSSLAFDTIFAEGQRRFSLVDDREADEPPRDRGAPLGRHVGDPTTRHPGERADRVEEELDVGGLGHPRTLRGGRAAPNDRVSRRRDGHRRRNRCGPTACRPR